MVIRVENTKGNNILSLIPVIVLKGKEIQNK